MRSYRVMLVDDEPLILSGIKFMIDWEKNNCELVATARNGKQALELMEQCRPDIVVTDINMPVMNGIELLRRTHHQLPHIVFIMLTNLEEFELVRDSMRMQAVDYITKSQIEPAALEQSLDLAKKEVERRGTLEQIVYEQTQASSSGREALQDALLRYLSQAHLREETLSILEQHGALQQYGVVRIRLPMADEQERGRLTMWLLEVAERIAQTCFMKHMILDTGQRNHSLYYWNGVAGGSKERVKRFAANLRNTSQDVIGQQPCLFETAELHGLEDRKKIREQFAAMERHHYLTGECALFYDQIPLTNTSPLGLGGISNRLQNELNSRNAYACANLVERIMEKAEQVPHERAHMLWICNEIFSAASKSIGTMPGAGYFADTAKGFDEIEGLYTKGQAIDWLKRFKNELAALLEPLSSDRSELLERAKQYIHGNIGKRITLQDAADYAFISPAYLSALFKKESGQNFVDYVNKTKMDEACRLIQSGTKRVSELSAMLGFDNTYYFSKVFRRHTGFSPTEYLQMQKKGVVGSVLE